MFQADLAWYVLEQGINIYYKGPGARAGHFPGFFSLFCNYVMQKILFCSKIHSFSKPVPLPPVRKWRTDLPEMRKRAVSRTKTFTNSLFGL